MASNNYLLGEDTPEENTAVGTAGDFAKTFGAGAVGVGGTLAGALRYGWELGGSEAGADIAGGLQKIFNATEEGIQGTINPETRKLAAAAMTSPEFWEHPVLATSLKATGMLPQVAAIAIPGGLLADAASATILAAGAGGVLNAGDGLNEFYKQLDAMSDKDLQEQSPKYRALRELMDEEPARKRFNREAQGWGPAINAVLGSVSGAFGPGGVAARGLAGGARNAVVGAGERGAIGSAAVGALEGAATNALEEGVQDITQQNAEFEADLRKEMDRARTANAALEGAALGGLFGGAVSAVAGGHKAPSTVKKADAELETVDRVARTATNDVVHQMHTGSASTPPAMPVTSPEVGNPQNEPTRSERDYGKDQQPVSKKDAGPPAPPPLDPAVAAAVASNDAPPVSAQPTEVAAMTQRSPNATLDLLDQEGQPAPAAPVPPEVTPQMDTGMNVPEQPQTIEAQLAQIGQGGRKAVLTPKGSPKVEKIAKGLKRYNNARGQFIYDPKLVTPKEIQALSSAGRENELLGLGPVSKPQAVMDAAAGAAPVAITERTPTGTEVKAAAGTTATLPEQRAALEATKSPGNVVAVETPEQVIAARTNPQGGRVLPNLQQPKAEREMVAPAPPEAPVVKEEAGPGTNYRGKRGQERDATLAAAQKAINENLPNPDAEEGYHRLPMRRDVVVNRLRKMVAEYEKATGKQVQTQIKRSKDGKSASDDPNVLLLRLAKDVVRTADKSPQGKAITDLVAQYKTDEALVRAGAADEVVSRRLEEGDRSKRQSTQEQVEQAADETPERDHDKREDEVVDEAEEQQVGDASGVKDRTDEEISAREHDEADVTGSEEIKQGPSVKHVEVKFEKPKAMVSAREARKAALANLRPPTKAKPAAQQEALNINRSPSEAQIAAGNYKKGHRRVEGLDFTIENPKGAIRRGVENGRPWEVRMPADYGYIRRTTGADGEHIDAYDGRRGDRYFIIDQLDARTREFDEHKVMMRFRSEEDAVAAYHAAFSDGKGPQRLGFIHEVSPQELRDWLNGPDTASPHIETLVRDMDTVNFDVKPGGRFPVTAGNGVTVWPTRSTSAAAALDALDLSGAEGINAPLAKFFQSRLRRLAGETDVHYVSREDMSRLAPEAVGATGLHVRNVQTGKSEIYLWDKVARGTDVNSEGHVLMHELAHAATVREIERTPGAEAMISRLARIAYDHFDQNVAAIDLELGPGVIDYGFTNAKEFIAEAFSNPKFQDFLSRVEIRDAELARYLGLDTQRSMSAWDAVRKFVQQAIEKITGKLPTSPTVLDGILKVGEHLTKLHEISHPSPYAKGHVGDTLVRQEAFIMPTRAAEQVRQLLESRAARDDTPKNLRLRTFSNIAEIADRYFGGVNPIRKIHNALERQRVTGERIYEKSEPILRKLATLRAKDRAAFEEFSSLLHDATVANVHPDVALTDAKNAHLGKNRLDAVWAKAQHADLAKRFRAMSEEHKQAWHEATKHFRDQQNAMSLKIMENQVLKLLGIEDAALARRIHEGTLTDADRSSLGDNLEVIEAAAELSKIHGPYVPLMRRGDHVVKGTYKVTSPGNAKKISDNELEFTTRKEAEDYAKASPLQAAIKKIWIDPKTGERLGADELDSVDRYRVTVQNQHVEFIQGRRAAEARAAELAQDGSLAVHEVVPRRFEPDGRAGAELSTSLSRLVKKLERSPAYEAATPSQRATLRQAINEAALASHGSTRVSSRSLPRRGVKGFSEDLVQNTSDYGESSSRYLAKLEHAPELEAALKEMEERIQTDHSKKGQYARTAISNEVLQRVDGDNGFQQGGALAPVVKRLLSASFTDKLASPAYSIINAMQPGMVTMPYLMARYGVGRTFSAMSKAYGDINSRSLIAAGAKGTVSQLKKGGGAGDLMQRVMKGLSADEKRMLQYQMDVGTIDANAGMEVHDIARSYEGVGGKTDAVLSYMEGVSREMPRAIETINRSVTALATYRLERSKGASHDVAVQAAQDAVNNTQFNYSPTNSPPVFNHPLLKIALQFKKYGQGMYQLIGTQIGDAIRPMNPGDRARAVKTLIGIAATHFAMAGALGLPTEPFKYLIMASSPVTGLTWGDVENEIRRQAAALFGKTGGEVLTRGLPRFLNLDLSRMGLDSVTSFGEPRGTKESDVKSWLFDSVSGPVVSLGGDYIKGINHLANGEVTKAAEKMIPLKAASDSIRAYRQATEGKKSESGKQTSAPYSPTEAGLRALGFGSGREAEEGAQRGAFYRGSERQKTERSSLVNSWVNAKPAEKAKAWASVQKFNATAPAEVKITMKELTDKLKRDAKAAQTAKLGINPNKRDKRFLEEGVYNLR